MLKTDLIQDCYEYRVSTTETEFRIETTIVSKGELPQEQIFVFTIVVEDDPGGDKFARVGSPRDLRELVVSRDKAIANGQTEYLASFFMLSYPILEVAINAKAAVTSRINECINTWVSYRDTFEDDGTTHQMFPTVDASFEQAKKDAYAAAKAARITKDAAVTSAEAALLAAEDDVTNAETVLAIYEDEAAFCAKDRISTWVPLNAEITSFTSSAQTQLTSIKATFMDLAGISHSWPPVTGEVPVGDLTTLYYEILAISNSIDGYNSVGAPLAVTLDSDFLAFCQSAAANVISYTNIKTAADAAVVAAVKAKEEADAALASAISAEAAALAAVKAICPDFDPSTV